MDSSTLAVLGLVHVRGLPVVPESEHVLHLWWGLRGLHEGQANQVLVVNGVKAAKKRHTISTDWGALWQEVCHITKWDPAQFAMPVQYVKCQWRNCELGSSISVFLNGTCPLWRT